MPEGAIYVGRPGPWGNPYRAGDEIDKGPFAPHIVTGVADAVRLYRAWALDAMAGNALPQANGDPAPTREDIAAAFAELRGKDLACWCPLDQPCHADVLLELANS